MKKIFAILLASAILLTLAACAGTETESTAAEATTAADVTTAETTAEEVTTEEVITEEVTTEEVTTEEVTTEEVTTEEVTTEEVTTEEVTTEEVTTEEITTEEVTTEEVTTEEVTTEEVTTEEVTTEEVTTEEVTTAAEETQPAADDTYEFEGIRVKKPEGYTFKEFSGLPSGLKDGVDAGNCFFNFSTVEAVDLMTDESADAFLEATKAMLPNFGNCTKDGFKSYEVDGKTVTKLDYTWEIGISQSIVRVHLDDHVTVIQFATLTTIPEGKTDFNGMIDSLTIVK